MTETRRLRRSDCYARIVDDDAPHQLRLTQAGTDVQVSCVCGHPVLRYRPTLPGGLADALARYSTHVDAVVDRNDWAVRDPFKRDLHTDVLCPLCGARPGERCRPPGSADMAINHEVAHKNRVIVSQRRAGVVV